MINNFDEIKFHKDLRGLGILPEDTVLINLNIAKFGLIKGFKRTDYIEIFKRYFQQGGGMFFTVAFTPSSLAISTKNIPYFDGTQAAYTGAFANAMLKDKDSFRSAHPTSSIVAIGVGAEEFTSNLDADAGAYTFVRNLIEKKGKVLLVGMSEYPGFVTHLVEQDLKLYRQYWSRFFLKVKVGDRIFTRRDPGGCSNTFERLYPEYIRREVLRVGRVNNAYSLAVDSVDAYDIDLEIISNNPAILVCSDKKCEKCRLFPWKFIWKLPIYVFTKLLKRGYELCKKV